MHLDEEHQLIFKTAIDFANKELAPCAEQWSEHAEFPHKAIKAMGPLGFLGMLVPDNYGGSNVGYLAYCMVIEALAQGDGATSTIVSVHNSVACLPIFNYGTEAQKNYYLPKMCSGEWLGAFCLTEPQAGSDARNLQTKATLEGDFYVLNGVKQFITSGLNAQIAIVFAVTQDLGSKKEISAFIVPTNTPGYTVARLEKKMGQSASELAQIVFENCRIPKKNLLGKVGEGYKIALSQLEAGRLGIAAQAVGMGQAALDAALRYAKERESFGKKLIEHQSIAFLLADMSTRIEAARQLIYYAATLKSRGKDSLLAASQAKLFATENAEWVARQAIQIHGGYGYLRDFPVERIYRDLRVTCIYEGTSEIQKMIIARELS